MTPRSIPSPLWLVLVLGLLACEGAQGRPDGGMDAGFLVGHDTGDHFSDCALGGDDCDAGERCAWGRISPGGSFGLRCTDEPGTLDEGAACALDVAVTFPDGARYDTSRCADDLLCVVGTGTTGICVRPCHLLGCDAGQICAGYWESCREAVDCDPDTHAPCAEGERCDAVTALGAAEPRWICAPTGDGAPGDACVADTACARELGCLDGRCTTTCDPGWHPTSPTEDGAVSLPDGGALRPPRCEDGSMCVGGSVAGVERGLCQIDFFSDCELDDPASCDAGERCAWGRIDGSGHAGTRCVTESGALTEGAACALDVAVELEGGWSYRTSRCGEGLACSVGIDGVNGTCVQPCDAFGCAAGELCPGAGEVCIADVRCDVDTEAPCTADQRCEHVVPYGAAGGVLVCRAAGDVGDACGSDRDCQRALGCMTSGGVGTCSETCDPSYRPVPPGTDGGSMLPDGGWTAPGRCADGALCLDHIRDDGSRTGLCLR